MRKNLHDNIAVKQAKTAIFAAVIVGLLFSIAQLAYDLVQEQKGVQQDVLHIMNSVKDPATKAAYNLSADLAENVLAGAFENPQVKEGYIFALFGAGEKELLAEHVRPTGTSRIDWLAKFLFDDTKLYSLDLTLSDGSSAAGLLQIRIDGQYLAQSFIDRAIVVLTAGLLRNFLLTFVLVFAFYNTLTKPILEISHKIKSINVDRPESSLLKIPAHHENDEFGSLIRGINTSLTQLGSNLQRRRVAETEKENSMKMFHSLAKTSSDIFWETDQNNLVTVISDDLGSLDISENLGLGGANLIDLLEDHCPQDFQNFVRELETAPRDFRDIQLNFTADKKPLILSFCGSSNFDTKGKFEGFLGTATNITETVLQAAEIADAKEKLRQAQKMEAVGQLTGGIAHDFNNLLAIIIGNLELIEENIEGQPELKSRIAAAIRSGEKGAELTQQLLSFSRKQSLNPILVDVNGLLEGLSEMLRRTLGGEISIKTDFKVNLIKGMIDPTQFENAIINLSLNARDAMSTGGTLSIETENYSINERMEAISGTMAPGVYVRVTVSDTGTGMDPSTLQKAMEPFFTTKDVGKGSGMGLAMVFGFIAQSAGHIQILSEVNKGTKVHLYLPSDKTARSPAPNHAASDASYLKANNTL
ncbi:MAG: ATP-binding protein [Sneathiella sp.]